MNANAISKAVLSVNEPWVVADWFCDNLGFKKRENDGELSVASGNLQILLHKGDGQSKDRQYGLIHIAVNAKNVDSALQHCEERGLVLDTDGGKPHFNPQVYGTGMKYFNIQTPFGMTVEVSERLDRKKEYSDENICGLEHYGLLSKSAESSLEFYKSQGFDQLCDLVINQKDIADIHCVFVGRGPTEIEVFSAENLMADFPASNCCLERLIISADKEQVIVGNDGEILEYCIDQ